MPNPGLHWGFFIFIFYFFIFFLFSAAIDGTSDRMETKIGLIRDFSCRVQVGWLERHDCLLLPLSLSPFLRGELLVLYKLEEPVVWDFATRGLGLGEEKRGERYECLFSLIGTGLFSVSFPPDLFLCINARGLMDIL